MLETRSAVYKMLKNSAHQERQVKQIRKKKTRNSIACVFSYVRFFFSRNHKIVMMHSRGSSFTYSRSFKCRSRAYI